MEESENVDEEIAWSGMTIGLAYMEVKGRWSEDVRTSGVRGGRKYCRKQANEDGLAMSWRRGVKTRADVAIL